MAAEMKRLQNMEKMTIYDVAKLANVSASTVSRVLNGTANVKEDKKERVLAVLNAKHFVPDETARGLVNQSTKMIGILISDLRTTHHAEGVYYLQRELSKIGYSCLIYNTGTQEEEQALSIRSIGQRNVDAAILMGSIYQNELVLQAIENYLAKRPVFICNGYLPAENVYGLISDEEEGVRQCVELLRKKGKTHPVFLVNRYTPSNLQKKKGFEQGVAGCFEGQEPFVIETGDSDEDIYNITLSLLKEHPETDSIIYADDMMALAGLHALYENGIEIPKRVAVIGINNSKFARLSNPALTSLDNMLYDLSVTASRNLCALLKGERVNKKMMLYSEIVERETT